MGLWSTLFGDSFLKHRERGDRYRSAGELGLAKAEYECALRRARGRTETELAEVRQALQETKRMLVEANEQRARELAELGCFEEAANALHFALELADEEEAAARLRAELASLDRRQKTHEKAQIDAETKGPEGDEFMGDTFEERFEIFLMGLEDPEVAEQYRARGEAFAQAVLLLQEGEATRAIAALQDLLAGGDDHPLVHLELGRALLFAGGTERSTAAVDHLRRWVDGHPTDYDASTTLAEALRQAGRADEATELLEQVADEAPPDSLALQHLAEHLVILGEWQAAAAACQEGLAHRPRATELKRLLGVALHGLGRSAEATKLMEAVLRERWRFDPETGELEFDRATAASLARIYLAADSLGQAERALDLLRALEQGAPEAERPGLELAMAEALLRLGQRDEARRQLETALALAGENAELGERIRKMLEPLRG